MKISKKITLLSSLIVITASVIAYSAAANDPTSSKINEVSKTVNEINKLEQKELIKVGDTKITNVDVLKYKAYNSIQSEQAASETDQEVLEQLVSDELFNQLAIKRGVNASLADGINEAKKNRELLKAQPQNIQDIQNEIIRSMGVSEDQYWDEIAPQQYQKFISYDKLANLLIKEGTLKFDEKNPNAFGRDLKSFKKQLYNDFISNSK